MVDSPPCPADSAVRADGARRVAAGSRSRRPVRTHQPPGYLHFHCRLPGFRRCSRHSERYRCAHTRQASIGESEPPGAWAPSAFLGTRYRLHGAGRICGLARRSDRGCVGMAASRCAGLRSGGTGAVRSIARRRAYSAIRTSRVSILSHRRRVGHVSRKRKRIESSPRRTRIHSRIRARPPTPVAPRNRRFNRTCLLLACAGRAG